MKGRSNFIWNLFSWLSKRISLSINLHGLIWCVDVRRLSEWFLVSGKLDVVSGRRYSIYTLSNANAGNAGSNVSKFKLKWHWHTKENLFAGRTISISKRIYCYKRWLAEKSVRYMLGEWKHNVMTMGGGVVFIVPWTSRMIMSVNMIEPDIQEYPGPSLQCICSWVIGSLVRAYGTVRDCLVTNFLIQPHQFSSSGWLLLICFSLWLHPLLILLGIGSRILVVPTRPWSTLFLSLLLSVLLSSSTSDDQFRTKGKLDK